MPDIRLRPNHSVRLLRIRSELDGLSLDQVVRQFGIPNGAEVLKTTISLCPECLEAVPAAVSVESPKVWIQKLCPTHGPSRAIAENDERFYFLSNKDRWGRRYSSRKALVYPEYASNSCAAGSGCDCGSSDRDAEGDFAGQAANKTCTVLVEVTDACNLACAVCYSDARGNRVLPFALFREYILRLVDSKGGLDSVQLTGGEAILHPDFWEMVRFLHGLPLLKKIYLPTNGIEFARPAVADRLAPYRDKVMVLLQFDGREPGANHGLRNAHPLRAREAVLEHMARLRIHVQLTMTLAQGVNETEIGWVVRTGLRHSNIKVVALQPVTYSGRHELPQHAHQRLTVSDVVKSVVDQVPGLSRESDFNSIPCSHPNCGWITLFARRFGITRNISRHIQLDEAMNRVANRTVLNTRELRSIVSNPTGTLASRVAAWAGRKLIRSTDIFAIAVKPFMDRHNYDQDRVSACCHHLLNTRGEPVSFCEYNARLRTRDRWDRFPKLDPNGD